MNMLSIEQRAIILGEYIIETHDTVRGAAKMFGISKSTVHKDVAERLEYINKEMLIEVKKILEEHKDERHIRGGLATREKYKKIKALIRTSNT